VKSDLGLSEERRCRRVSSCVDDEKQKRRSIMYFTDEVRDRPKNSQDIGVEGVVIEKRR
jgi:hypothetical protein